MAKGGPRGFMRIENGGPFRLDVRVLAVGADVDQ